MGYSLSLNTCAILAGNSRVDISGAGIVVTAQLAAFAAALARAAACRDVTNHVPIVAIAFDHRGVFRKHFLKDGVSNSRKRHPRLSDVHPTISSAFTDICESYRISLDSIYVIHEDSAKTNLTHLLDEHKLPLRIAKYVQLPPPPDEDRDPAELKCDINGFQCGLTPNGNGRINCAGITSEYYRRTWEYASTSRTTDLLEVFIEYAPWTQVPIYLRGLQIAHMRGVTSAIQLHLVPQSGRYWSGTPAMNDDAVAADPIHIRDTRANVTA